jgi:hypothetical protein
MVSLAIKFSAMVTILVIASFSAVISYSIEWIAGYVMGGALMAVCNWVYHDEKFQKLFKE